MQRLVLSSILSFILLPVIAQTSVHTIITRPFLPKETTISYKLGERVLQLKTFQYGNTKDLVYINLHDDEMTSVNGAKKLLEKYGGFLIKIENYRVRNIKFKLEDKNYAFDPNRMFSRQGIIQSLILHGRISDKAVEEVEKFANRVLQLIPGGPSCIVALHNNSNGSYSINSYLPGNLREKDAKQLYKNTEQDPDDIFLTTDSVLYKQLAEEKKFNTILQDNANAKKDGSLSIYCGEKNIRYINCETEHGKQEQYDEMIASAFDHIIQQKNSNTISYNYRLVQAGGHYSPKTNTDILFGEKKIGMIASVTKDSSSFITGKLEMNKDFPLYSNTDFFLFISSGNTPHLEARIDPTRNGKRLDPATSTISISVKGVK
ncbi:MAG: hypothetical protein Q8941_12615 [Bacteroidota bacterium]|nr:hypothetical protein [Bacteroidota bacterium]